ncbi:MAG: NAD(P)-dependent oxidoreductase [Nannocystales bacterium]
MLVLIADKLPAAGLANLRDLGLTVDSRPDLNAETIPEALRETGAGALVVRSTKVTAAAFDAASGLGLVVRAGAGVNTIDLDAASRNGVFVANCPGRNAIAVAELTMGLLLAMDRRIPDAVADLRAGKWRKKHYGKAAGLLGRRLGLVGFGAIAQAVAARAQAFGMEVGAYSRSLTESRASAFGVKAYAQLDDLLDECDAISVHVPFSAATKHLIGASQFARMKDGAMFLHTARGGVVDDAALRDAVSSGKVRAGLDVFEEEPAGGDAAFETPLQNVAGIYGTPHIGASTEQAQLATAAEVVRIIGGYMDSGEVANVVNVVPQRETGWSIVVRHRDRVGVLASVLQSLREEDTNVQEMQNVIFRGNEAASATIVVQREPTDGLLTKLRAHQDILSVEVRAIGPS